MTIYTCYVTEHSDEFRKLKRKTAAGEWEFLISGEWSSFPHNNGEHSFYIRSSPDKRYWALHSSNRIIAVAHTPEPTKVEAIGAAMMRAADENGGDSIEFIHDTGDFDSDLLWELYCKNPDPA